MCCWWRSTTSYLAGIQVSCPYLYCNSKNSQFQHAGRFPSGNNRICDVHQADEVYLEFVLNHLHSSHKHRRFNGDSLDMTMVVPQVDVEQNSNTIRWGLTVTMQCWSEQLGKLENWNVFLSERRVPPRHSMGRTPRTGNWSCQAVHQPPRPGPLLRSTATRDISIWRLRATS